MVIVGVLCPLAKSLVVVIYLSGGIFPAAVARRAAGRWQYCLREAPAEVLPARLDWAGTKKVEPGEP